MRDEPGLLYESTPAAPGNPEQVLWTRIKHTLAADGIDGVLLSAPGILGARGSKKQLYHPKH